MEQPQLIFTIEDGSDEIIRKLTTTPKAGINRIAWDLRYPTLEPIMLEEKEPMGENEDAPKGLMAPPGTYKATMYLPETGLLKNWMKRFHLM